MLAKDLKPWELLTINPKTGFPFFGSFRVLVLGMPFLARLQKGLMRGIGAEKAMGILAHYGYESGLGMAATFSELYDFDGIEEFFKAGAVLSQFSGMAHEEITEFNFDPENMQLNYKGIWRESYEALIWESEFGKSASPVCNILAGMASGYASAVLGKEFQVREITCKAQGHEHCTYEGRLLDDWWGDPGDVQSYMSDNSLEEELAHIQEHLRQAKAELERSSKKIIVHRFDIFQHGVEHGIIFRSPSMAQVLSLALKVAPTRSTVLIQGDSGTGKEILARFIHQHSDRLEDPFLAINCAALPPTLLESELFGHVKGAFTGADADKKGLFVEAGKGTLFLDEVGELPLELQAKLLRALQEKEVRPVGGVKDITIEARIIAATNQDLKAMVAENRFREDLYYRLAVFPLHIQALRERKQDILYLARHFLDRFKPGHPGLSPEALRKMEAYSWPGNVRELENWVEYALVLAGEERIMPEHLPPEAGGVSVDPLQGLIKDQPTLEELEARYIRLVLEHTDNNKAEAARILGTSQTTLWRRLKTFEDKSKGNPVDGT